MGEKLKEEVKIGVIREYTKDRKKCQICKCQVIEVLMRTINTLH